MFTLRRLDFLGAGRLASGQVPNKSYHITKGVELHKQDALLLGDSPLL